MSEKHEADPTIPRDIATALDLIDEMRERGRVSFVEARALAKPLRSILEEASSLNPHRPHHASAPAALREPMASSVPSGRA